MFSKTESLGFNLLTPSNVSFRETKNVCDQCNQIAFDKSIRRTPNALPLSIDPLKISIITKRLC